MARAGGRARPGWVWPVIVLLSLLILGIIAWAFLAQPAPVTQPIETAPAPAMGPPTISDIVENPAGFYGANVTLQGSIMRTVGDQGIYLAGTGDSALLAVMSGRVADSGLRQGDLGSFSGTIREVNSAELDRLAASVDKPTLDALANERAYLSMSNFTLTVPPTEFPF